MDIREKPEILRHKLAGMISAAVEPCDEGECCESCKYFHSTACTDYLIADHLIANGVTVLDWRPASEPPKDFVSVLGYMTDAGDFPPVRECYTVGNGFYFPALREIHPISHWCEMPQPPKGE